MSGGGHGRRGRLGSLPAALLLTAAMASPAAAQTPGSLAAPNPNVLTRPASGTRPPPLHTRSANQAIAIASRVPKIRDVLSRHHGVTHIAYEKGPTRWQVSYYAHARHGLGKEIGQVIVDDPTGQVVEAWTGFQVAWSMARGYPGAFGRKSNALYIWIPLCLLFLVPFIDRRRLLSMRHLDLLVLLSFSISLAIFNHANIGLSVPLAYPPLLYLLGRALWLGWRPGREEPFRLLIPSAWLAIGLVFLAGFRVGLDVTDSNVIDVGYSGVIGGHRVLHGQTIYGHYPNDDQRGDTYGPVTYYAYVPAVAAWPWSGNWDDLPAAHAAAVAFDLLTLLLLFLLGRRIRGPTLGIALAYAWVAYPFTLFTLSSNSNDSLVAALVTACLLVLARPLARGALGALAGLTKFAPLALAPLLIRGTEGKDPSVPWRRMALAALAFVVVGGLAMLPVTLEAGGLHRFWERTIEFQQTRGSPFSVWGLYGDLGFWQAAVKVAAAGLAVLVAFLPRRRDAAQVAALAAAVLIAVELGITHWFYLYLVWFLPPLLLVVLLGAREPRRAAA